MIDDLELSRRLTSAIRAVPHVTGVYPAQPILEAAAGAIAVRLALRVPDVLVDIDRAEGFTTVSAHIATSAAAPTPETARAVGELLRDEFRRSHEAHDALPGTDPNDTLAINVKVRLVEDAGAFGG